MPRLRPLSFLAGLDHRLDLFSDGAPLGEERLEHGLHPPLPVSGNVLVWGFALLREARRRGRGDLPCVLLGALAAREMLGLALAMEGRAGGYSWEERLAMADFAAAARRRGEPFDMGELGMQIEGKTEPRLEERLREFAGLPEGLRRLVNAGRLDLHTAKAIQELPGDVAEQAAEAPLSFSARRQFLVTLREVGLRDRLSAGQLSQLSRRLLAETDPLGTLRRLRNPDLTRLEARLAVVNEASLRGSGVHLRPPPWFEGRSYRVEFDFASPAVLGRRLQALRRLQDSSDELFELLR